MGVAIKGGSGVLPPCLVVAHECLVPFPTTVPRAPELSRIPNAAEPGEAWGCRSRLQIAATCRTLSVLCVGGWSC